MRSANPREVFKLTKLWRNYHEVAELRKRQSPAALREEVMRALQTKSFAHARKIMEANAEVDFVLQGPSSEDHDGQPMLVLATPLSCAEAGKLVAAMAAAREAVLSAKVSVGGLTRDLLDSRGHRLGFAIVCTVIIVDFPPEIIDRGSCGRRN